MTARAITPTSAPMSPASGHTLHVEALSLIRRGLPGPALSGRTGVELVASVLTSDGNPVASLAAESFEIRIVAGPVRLVDDGARLPVRLARESIPGVYTLIVESPRRDGAHEEPEVLALTVQDAAHGGRQGRALVRVDG